LLRLLVQTFAPHGPLIFGLHDARLKNTLRMAMAMKKPIVLVLNKAIANRRTTKEALQALPQVRLATRSDLQPRRLFECPAAGPDRHRRECGPQSD
jgi:hypothetical protein